MCLVFLVGGCDEYRDQQVQNELKIKRDQQIQDDLRIKIELTQAQTRLKVMELELEVTKLEAEIKAMNARKQILLAEGEVSFLKNHIRYKELDLIKEQRKAKSVDSAN